MIHDIQDFNERMRDERVQRNLRLLRWVIAFAVPFAIGAVAAQLMGC
ncbi:hypothetical protein N6G06_07560 [Cupriavidus gilardii]|nr:hypothetical protein [Cupriavidus gilardii]MCT9071219.1 hypothetical protein [Cupriavidus gilardii]